MVFQGDELNFIGYKAVELNSVGVRSNEIFEIYHLNEKSNKKLQDDGSVAFSFKIDVFLPKITNNHMERATKRGIPNVDWLGVEIEEDLLHSSFCGSKD